MRKYKKHGDAYMKSKQGFTLIELMVVMVIIAILVAILLPVFASARGKARQTVCLSNMRQIAVAMVLFASEHNEKLPDAGSWTEDIQPYLKSHEVLRCPCDSSDTETSYAMNPALSGKSLGVISDTSNTVLLYETGYEEDARHNGGNCYAFADSHVKWYKEAPPFGG